MAIILLAWELGGGLGHTRRLAPLAREIVRRGHHACLCLKDTKAAHVLSGSTRIQLLPAPFLARPLASPVKRISSFAHILHQVGFGDAPTLARLTEAWRAIYATVKPDLIVCDFAPTALLATKGLSLPVAQVGHGFFIPPDEYPMPDLRPESPTDMPILQTFEDQILANANRVLATTRVASLKQLSELHHRDVELFLTTYPQLDHYPHRGPARYYGPIQNAGATGDVPVWPVAPGPRVFAYLKPFAGLDALIEHLRALQFPMLIYAPGTRAASSATLSVATRELDMSQTAGGCDFAITHGTIGACSDVLAAGKPLLMLPITLEQGIIARRITSLAAGVTAPIASLAAQLTALGQLITHRDAYTVAAQSLADSWQDCDPVDQVRLIVDRFEQMMSHH